MNEPLGNATQRLGAFVFYWIHAGGGRVWPVFYLFEFVHLQHAGAGSRAQYHTNVCLLGKKQKILSFFLIFCVPEVKKLTLTLLFYCTGLWTHHTVHNVCTVLSAVYSAV